MLRYCILSYCILNKTKGIKHGHFTSFHSIDNPFDRFSYLVDIRNRRLAEPISSSQRMSEICQMIPENLEDRDLMTTGYHRGCYQHFTKNLSRLSSPQTDPESSCSRSPRKSSTVSGILFGPECIFCNKAGPKKVKVDGELKKEIPIKFTLQSACQNIESIATKQQNHTLLRKVKGVDLRAAEAKFHPHCRKLFDLNRYPTRGHSKRKESVTEQSRLSAAHDQAFGDVVEFVKYNVLERKEVVQLSNLRLIYVTKLDESSFANKDLSFGTTDATSAK